MLGSASLDWGKDNFMTMFLENSVFVSGIKEFVSLTIVAMEIGKI